MTDTITLVANIHYPCPGCIARTVSSPNQHLLRSEDVVSCCLDLNVPSISFRINGQPVQGMFENFNSDGLFFPAASFSAGVRSVCDQKVALLEKRTVSLQNQNKDMCFFYVVFLLFYD